MWIHHCVLNTLSLFNKLINEGTFVSCQVDNQLMKHHFMIVFYRIQFIIQGISSDNNTNVVSSLFDLCVSHGEVSPALMDLTAIVSSRAASRHQDGADVWLAYKALLAGSVLITCQSLCELFALCWWFEAVKTEGRPSFAGLFTSCHSAERFLPEERRKSHGCREQSPDDTEVHVRTLELNSGDFWDMNVF